MSEVFRSFFKMIKNQFEVYIKNLRSDNVREGFYLKQKSEMSEVFPSFFKMIKNQFEVYIKNLRSDNVRDLFNQTFSHFLQKEGIVHYSSYVDTPQQNEATEQKNRHLLEDT